MSDNLLVNRNGQTYQVDMENTKEIQDTDLLLVNRNGTTYTVAGDQISRGDFSEVIISPVAITPETSEQIITATADIPKVGSSVPADVFWNWYLYDEATGDIGKTLVQSTTNREITDTFILPASAAGKFIGCSVEYLAVTIDETQRCAVGLPDGPVADMHGLRFDPNRETYLERRFSDAVGPFTFSCWVKITQNTTNGFLLGLDSYGILVNADDPATLYYTDGSATPQLSDVGAIPQNKWTHIVVTYSGQDDGQEFNAYINGVSTGYTPSHNAGRTTVRIGRNNTGSYFSGYLSDYYYVDGAVLEPTAFGKEFPEGWGPLDSSQVEESIENSKVQPYDTRPNYEQEWSNGTTTNENSNNPVTSMCDGDRSVFNTFFNLTAI